MHEPVSSGQNEHFHFQWTSSFNQPSFRFLLPLPPRSYFRGVVWLATASKIQISSTSRVFFNTRFFGSIAATVVGFLRRKEIWTRNDFDLSLENQFFIKSRRLWSRAIFYSLDRRRTGHAKLRLLTRDLAPRTCELKLRFKGIKSRITSKRKRR